MNTGKTVFAQLMDLIPAYEFQKCVERYRGNYKVIGFSCRDQFRCMAFAQLTYRESLRDIEICLRAQNRKLYHMGIHSTVSRNTLANANERRDWRIYADFAQVMIRLARDLYAGDEFGVELANTTYALDSTVIDLCLSLFPWARVHARQAAVKMHTQLDLRGPIPAFVKITDGNTSDVSIIDELLIEPGAVYIMDRGYINFERLYRFAKEAAYFIVRDRKNTLFRRVASRPVVPGTGIRSDQIVALTGIASRRTYPDLVRRIRYYSAEHDIWFAFLTNNFELEAITIAQLYKCRWQVELFFKWIKQHLRIKAFFGTSCNAVKTQIWIAISVYVLVAIVKKRCRVEHSLYAILQILSVTAFEKVDLYQLLTTIGTQTETPRISNQPSLFE